VFGLFRRIALLTVLAAAAGPACAGYLDENPDEIFAGVYERIGKLPQRAARDPFVWLRLEELKREPCDQKSMTDMAAALEKLGYRREAGQGLYSFVKACGAPVNSLYRAGDIFLKLSDYATAAEIGDEFIRRAPDNANAFYLRGQGLQAAGDHLRAITDFANAIELYANDKKSMGSAVFTQMARSYAALGRFCEAASPILMWVAIDPVARDTSRTRKIIADYEQNGNCATAKEFQKERYPLPGNRHVVTVKAEVNGVKGMFILDTGASYMSVKSEFAERAKIPLANTADITLSTANGQAKGKLSKADKVMLGKLEAANVPTVVQNTDAKSYGTGVDGLLGMSFLSRFDLKMSGGFIEIQTRRRN
jgi:aspartyl protease family protein